MPFIRTTTNVNLAVDQEKRLRTGTAELVRDILNKDPIRMMTAYEGNIHLCRGGDDRWNVPTAFVECKFFEAFAKAMHELYRNVLSIQPQDLYIKYEVIYGWDEPAKIFKI